MTSLGGPLIGLAVAIDDGWSPSGVLALLITLLLAATGPVVQAATARAIALRDKPRSAKVAP